MNTGCEEFFEWCNRNDAYALVGYMTPCGELEITIHMLGEETFYRKRAGDFERALDAAKEHFGKAYT